MNLEQCKYFQEGEMAFEDGEQMCHNPYLDEEEQELSDAAVWWANGYHQAEQNFIEQGGDPDEL